MSQINNIFNASPANKVRKLKAIGFKNILSSYIFSVSLLVFTVFILYWNTAKSPNAFYDESVKIITGVSEADFPFIPVNVWSKTFTKLTRYIVFPEIFAAKNISGIAVYGNFILFLLSVIVLFFFLKDFFKKYNFLLALGTTILFTVHPMQTEVVNCLMYRTHIMSFLLGTISYWLIYRYTLKHKLAYLFAAFLIVFFSMLCFPATIGWIFMICFGLFLMRSPVGGSFVWLLFVLNLVVLITLAVLLVLPEANRPLAYYDNPLIAASYTERFVASWHFLLHYLKSMIWPEQQLYYYGLKYFNPIVWTNASFIYVLLGFILLIILALRYRKQYMVLVFGTVFLLSFLWMYSNLFFLIPGLFADRFGYTPILGLSLIVVASFLRLFKVHLSVNTKTLSAKPALIILLLLVALPLGYLNYKRSMDWVSSEKLLNVDGESLKKSVRHNLIMGNLAVKNKAENKAVIYYSRAFNVYPMKGKAANYLYHYYINKNDLDAANKYFSYVTIDNQGRSLKDEREN